MITAADAANSPAMKAESLRMSETTTA